MLQTSTMSDGVVPLLNGINDHAGGEGDVEEGFDAAYVSMDESLGRKKKAWGTQPCTCSCFGASKRTVLAGGFFISLLLVVIGLTVVVPAAVQTVLDESTLVTTSMYMKNPRLDRITLNATSELHDVGVMGATMEETDVDVYFQDELLGTMTLPELDIVGGEVLVFNMETDLIVKNATAFTGATARILQGHGGRWFFRGDVTVRLPLGLRYKVKINKLLLIPPTLLEGVTGSDGDVVDGSGTENTLDLVATTSMFSSSILEMHDLGEFVFDLFVKVDNATGNILNQEAFKGLEGPANHMVRIGQVKTANFDVRQGRNRLPSSGQIIKTKENTPALSQFMSAYLGGIDQVAYMAGPVQSAAIFLDNVVEQSIIFNGATDSKPVEVSLIDKETSFQGFTPDLPPSANVGKKAPIFRGPKIVVHNTLSASVLQRNVSSLINLAEPISFRLNHPLLGKHECLDKKMFAHLYTAEGMYKHDPSLPPVVTFGPNEKKTVFMPGGPQEGQSTGKACAVFGQQVADGADCCFVAMQVAAACRAEAKGHASFDTELESMFEMAFGDFSIPLDVKQKGIATSFTSEVTKGFAADAFLTCSNIEVF